MLYVSTRNDRDAFTVRHALEKERCPDGGFFLPLREPSFSDDEIEQILNKPFNERIAYIVNLLCGTELCGWDIDFCVGRYPVRLHNLRQRMVVAECWHNPQWEYTRMVDHLSAHLCENLEKPTNWIKIVVRIAVLFGIFGEVLQSADQKMDVCMVSGDFSAPMAAMYARKWGLPIGNIICCCNENHGLWDLICYGQMRTDTVSIATGLPEADIALPENFERLIHACGGVQEVAHYLVTIRKGGLYCPPDTVCSVLRQELSVSVVSSHRIGRTISSVYSTHKYICSQETALAYAGLQDYRAKAEIIRPAFIISDKSPACDLTSVSGFLGMSERDLRENL